MNRQQIQSCREQIWAVGKKYGAKTIKLFGSVARGQEEPDSDVDFMVELEPGRSLLDLGGLQMELEELLGCPVDVVTPKGLRKRIQAEVLEEAVAI